MAEPTTEEDAVNAGELVKPENMRRQIRLEKSVPQTIAKLKATQFQYATAGDARRLVEQIALLFRQNEELRKALEQCAGDLADYIAGKYPQDLRAKYPSFQRNYDAEMTVVKDAHALSSAPSPSETEKSDDPHL